MELPGFDEKQSPSSQSKFDGDEMASEEKMDHVLQYARQLYEFVVVPNSFNIGRKPLPIVAAIIALSLEIEDKKYTYSHIDDTVRILGAKKKTVKLRYDEIIHSVKQVLKKRSHKALDYDRHKDSLDKLSNKQSRSLDEERKLAKTREAFNTAELEFKTYDEQLKQQLPTFFDCSSNLYDSCLITFYSIQKDVFHIMYVYFYETANECGLNLNADIIAQYESNNCAALLEESKVDNLTRLLTTTHISTVTSNTVANPSLGSPVSPTGGNSGDDLPSYESATRNTYPNNSFQRPTKVGSVGAPSRPPPPAVPKRPTSVQYVTALYDFTAQNAGDISFKRGDRIEIVKKTDNANEWWTGKINGMIGQFPGNYVQ